MNSNSPSVMQFPSSDTILKGEFVRAKSAFAKSANLNQSQRSSGAMTLQDPVATHLLVETALGDSKGFEVLSYEELDGLKKEENMLVTRLEGLRHKLALESKVRDAAKSMNRLYNNDNGSQHGRRPSNSTQMSPVTAERAGKELEESEKKCEELGREYYYLEQRMKQIQFSLLKHTAGVLQATYGNGHRPRVDLYGLPGGRPYSPDSGEDFSKNNANANIANPAAERNWDKVFEYDDESAYGNGGDLEGFIDELKTPSKGNPNVAKQREAQMAIGKRLEELNAFVREILGQVNPKSPVAQEPSPKLPQDGKNMDVGIFDQLNSLSRGLDEIKEEQRSLKLERQLKSTPTTPRTPKMDARQQQQEFAAQRELQETEDRMARMIADLNAKFVDVMSSSAPQEVTPPIPRPELGSAAQVKYAQDRLLGITKVLRSLSLTTQRAQTATGNLQASQYDVVLQGLWQIIRSGEQDALKRKQDERQRINQRRKAGEDVDDSEAELSPDDETEEAEEFSLSVFSTKVQWLVAKSTYLREKQSDLQRRMRHLRSELEEREKARKEEIDSLGLQLERLDDEKEEAKEELRRAQMRLDERHNINQSQTNEITQSRKAVEDLQMQIRKRENETDGLRSQLDDTTRKHADIKDRLLLAEQSVRKWEADHGVAVRAKETSEKQARETSQKHERSQRDLMDMESQLARLTTELTVAKADLDAAQGTSRNERAIAEKTAREEAEARVGKLLTAAEDRERGLKKELESVKTMHRDAQSQVQRAEAQARALKSDPAAKEREDQLRRELEATLRDFEDLTRASVEAEKEREDLEKMADNLRDRVEELEVLVGEERIGKLGSSGSSSTTASGSIRNSDGSDRATVNVSGGTSALVLKNEFKKMMREARAEHQRALKHEQDERRKVESQLRSLRRDQATASVTAGKGKLGMGLKT